MLRSVVRSPIKSLAKSATGQGGGVAPPANSVAPVVSGTSVVGQTLSTTDGTWSGSPTFTYQWTRDGVNIGSATANTYLLVTADIGCDIACKVTGTNAAGNATGTSNAIADIAPDIATSIIAYWKMEENNANRADATGNGKTLTDVTTTANTTGKIGSAATFSSDRLTLSQALNADFSISFWVKFSGTGQQVIIGKNNFDSTFDQGFFLQLNGSGQITAGWIASGTFRSAFSSKVVTTGVWYHVAFTWDDTAEVGRLVVDGVYENSYGGSMSTPPSDLLTVGSLSPTGQVLGFGGQLDEVGLWSKVLSTAEILSLYNGGSPITYPFTALPGTAGYTGPYNVIWLIQQSNNIGWRTGTDAIDRVYPPGTKQWGRVAPNAGVKIDPFRTAGVINALENSEAVTPLLNAVTSSLALADARLYYAGDSSRPILIVPSAAGSTGYTNHWAPGKTLYEAELARVNAAMASHASNTLVAIFWAGGEDEVGVPVSQVNMAAFIDAQIADIRTRVTGAATVPFVLQPMVPAWVASNTDFASSAKTPVQAAIIDTPNRKTYTAVVDPSASPAQGATDNVHYVATDYRGTDGVSGLALKRHAAIATAAANH